MDEIKETKKSYKELEKRYDDLYAQYIKDRYAIIDAKKAELEDLKDEYEYNRLMLEKPLKAEKYRLKALKRKEHRRLNEGPKRGLLEEIGNSISHGVGALFGIAALVLMILKADSPLSLMAAIIYGSCIFFQMLFSCLYHSFRAGSAVKRIFRRFDYSSIYLEIGGTFAPLFLLYMPEKMWGLTWGLTLFSIQWALIILGITFVGVFGPGRIRWLHFTLYFCIGWSAIMFLPTWFSKDFPLFCYILGAGVVYTVGMIPFAALKKKPVAHFMFHLIVLIASVLMWVGIYLYVF